MKDQHAHSPSSQPSPAPRTTSDQPAPGQPQLKAAQAKAKRSALWAFVIEPLLTGLAIFLLLGAAVLVTHFFPGVMR